MQAAEFFAGMGLVRAGLERCGIATKFANDIDPKKASLYRENWGDGELVVGDVREMVGADVPTVDLATASSPCVDFSIAGKGAGLRGQRSAVLHDFCRVLKEMNTRAPDTVVIENVPGMLTSNDGADFSSVLQELSDAGYFVQHICVDAAAFVPQSRKRVFVIGSRRGSFRLPPPPETRNDLKLTDYCEDREGDWWPTPTREAFLATLSAIQSRRVIGYRDRDSTGHHGAFRRTRRGRAVWEVRADEKAGALRTTLGGSARQAVVRAGCGRLAVRWMNVREYANLQGAGHLRFDSVSPIQAMYALGDAVCVPVIEWVARHCLLPLMRCAR